MTSAFDRARQLSAPHGHVNAGWRAIAQTFREFRGCEQLRTCPRDCVCWAICAPAVELGRQSRRGKDIALACRLTPHTSGRVLLCDVAIERFDISAAHRTVIRPFDDPYEDAFALDNAP